MLGKKPVLKTTSTGQMEIDANLAHEACVAFAELEADIKDKQHADPGRPVPPHGSGP